MKLKFARQRTNYYCGPAIIQMILAAFGVRITQLQAAKLAKTDKLKGRATGSETGTSIKNMLAVLRSYNLLVRASNHRSISDIKKALHRDAIVIVCYRERHYGWGHYSIVLGFRGQTIHLLDPDEGPAGIYMSVSEFQSRWHDHIHTHTVHWAAFVTASEIKKNN